MANHCLEHTYPEFRQRVRDGQRIVVAGEAFGCGSSREEAVRALKGLGVLAVISKSFSFIFGRNQPSLGLLGITMADSEFHRLASDGVSIEIDVPERAIRVAGKEFPFGLSEMEYRLTANAGIGEAYKKYQNEIWKMTRGQAQLFAADERRRSDVRRTSATKHERSVGEINVLQMIGEVTKNSSGVINRRDW